MRLFKKIGRGISTVILGFLLIVTIILVVFLADTRATITNSDWVKSEMDKGGFYPAIRQELADELKDGLTDELDQEEALKVSDIVDKAVTNEWAKANFESNTDAAYSFFKSQRDELSLSITLPDTLKQSIKDAIKDIFTPESTDLSQEQINAGLAAINQQVDNLPQKLALQVENAQAALQPVRDAVKIYNYTFYILIAFAILLAMLLILLHFTVKDAIRVLGIPLLICGAICWGVAFTLNRMAPGIVNGWDLPDYITEDMAIKVMRDFISPANMYSIVLVVLAIVLIVASFFIQRKAKTLVP